MATGETIANDNRQINEVMTPKPNNLNLSPLLQYITPPASLLLRFRESLKQRTCRNRNSQVVLLTGWYTATYNRRAVGGGPGLAVLFAAFDLTKGNSMYGRELTAGRMVSRNGNRHI